MRNSVSVSSINLNLNSSLRSFKCKMPKIDIPPLILVLNSIFEILTVILLFVNDSLPEDKFLIWLIILIIFLVFSTLIMVYLPKKLDNMYPFHNFVLSFLMVYLFSASDSRYIQSPNVNFFLGFLAAYFQIFCFIESSVISGTISLIVSFLLYFFYFIKASDESLIFGYYFLLFFHLMMMKIYFEEKNQKSNAFAHDRKTLVDDVMSKMLKSVFPGICFVLNLNGNEIFRSNTHIENRNESSPLGRLDDFCNLFYANDASLEYGLGNSSDCLDMLDNIEVNYFYRQIGPLDLVESERKEEESVEEKVSDIILEENKKKNLLTMIKTRIQAMNLKISRNETSVTEENIIINGYLSYRLVDKKPVKLQVSFLEHERKIYLFTFITEVGGEEDLANMREVSKFKDQMLANVAHDLRSPITGIIAFINQSLEQNLSREEIEKLLDFAKINANLLLHLVGDILDFSQIKKGILNLVIKRFSLKELIEQVFNLMQFQAEAKNIRLILDYNLPSDVIMESDDRRLCQLLINLLSNAIKFTTKGSVNLQIGKTVFSNVLKFEVIDTGIGIKPEIMPHLFKPFSTFSDKALNNKYGIGLGLSICKMIVTLLGPGQRMYVSSEYGRGTTFGCLLFSNLYQDESSSGILNVNKRMWDKTELKVTSKKLNFTVLNHPENFGSKDNKFYKNSLYSPKHLEEKKLPFEESKFLDINKKLDVAEYFGDRDDDISVKFSGEIDLDNEISIPDQINENLPKKQLINPLKSSNIGVEQKVPNEDKKHMKKVFSLNCINERKGNKAAVLNILIVEDNPFNILILKNYLKKFKPSMNFTAFSAMNGEEACEIFDEHNQPLSQTPIDIVFMDCQMPIKNGYEATTYIKEKINNKGYIKTVIVAITAYCDESSCIESGMDAYLLKPVTERDFLEIFEIFFGTFIS